MAASSDQRRRRLGFSRRAKAAPQRSPSVCQLGFETLEDRALLSVSLSLNGPQTIVPGATLNVSTDALIAQSEMSLVINPTNPLNVVGFSHRLETPTITVELYVSVDGGLNFLVSEIDTANDGLGAVGSRFDPALQFDANGVLYIAYGYRGQATAPLRNTLLVVARSNDGGVNFSNYIAVDQQADILTASTTDTDTPGLDKWYIATGLDPLSGNQAVYLAYVAFVTEGAGMSAGTDAHISVIGSRDGGTNWTPRLVINDDSAVANFDSASYASPIVDSLGRLAVSWGDTDDTSIMIDRDMDGLWSNAETFGNDVTVRTGVDVARGAVLPPSQPERGINAAPMLEVWRAVNWLYIPVVEKYQGSNTDLDIWVGVSSDFGANWTFNRIDDSGGTEFNPWLQVDQTTGAVNVLYYTTDGDVGTGNDDVRPRLAMSNDGGATWTRTFLSTQTSNEGPAVPNNGDYDGDYLEYIGLGVRDGTAHGLWASRYMAGGTDLDAFTANAAFVSSTGDNRLFIGERGGVDDSFLIQQSPANPAFLEVWVDGVREFTGLSATLDHIIFNPGGGINTFNIGSLTGISSVTINGT
ncbi:MAG: exo-alpha-sialidase, partial [Pirellulales bacterium]|nr:exo-alpha-sialidase [Pirellulales bacterium]